MKKNISILKKILIDFLMIIALFLLVICLYVIVQVSLMHKKYFNIFGFTIFEVKTGSMANSIEIGDLVVEKLLNQNQKNSLKVGDIISYNDENYIITHRIKEINDKIVTKGDANNASDSPIVKEAVIGKVVKIIPKVGIYKKVLLDKKVIILICITISLFIISFSIKENSNNEFKDNNQKGKIDDKDRK